MHSDPASPSSPNDAHSFDVIRHRPAVHGHADDATLDMNEEHSSNSRTYSTYSSSSSTHPSGNGFFQQLYPRTLLQQASTILLIVLVYLVFIGPLSPDYVLNQASKLNSEILSHSSSSSLEVSSSSSCPPPPMPVRPSCPPAPECPVIEPTVCPPPPVAPLLVRVHSMRLHATPVVNASSEEPQSPVPNPQTLRVLRGQVNEQAESMALCPATSTQDEDTTPDSSCHAEAVKWSRSTGSLRGSSKSRHVREDPQSLPSCFVQSAIQGLGAFRQPHLSTFVDEDKAGNLPPYRVDYSWGSHLTTYDRGATGPLPFMDYTTLRSKLVTASRSSDAIVNPTGTTRILFVTEEMSDMGLPPATLPYGGAGSAISLLAQSLAAAKSEDGAPLYSVHVLHCKLHTLTVDDAETARSALQAHGIRLHAFPPHIANMRLDAYYASQNSYRVLLFLLQAESKGLAGDATGAQPFDIVHVYDYGGLGYHALRVREQGWAFRSTAFVCTAHGPASWATAANAQYPHEVEELEMQLLERRSVEWTDIFVSPSQYMASYMLKRQWQMPSLSLVLPNVQPAPDALGSSSDIELAPVGNTHSDEPPCEIVFFGRLEERKGLAVFLDAIAKLLVDARSDMLRHFKLTFLGRQLTNPTTGQASHEFIRDRISGWSKLKSKFIRRFGLPPLRLISDATRRGALAYLSQPDSGRVAVMASLMDNSPYVIVECLQAKVPFIASKVGGIPELIDTQDQERVLFEPNADALTRKLRSLITLPSGEVAPFAPQPAGAAFDREQVTAQHLALHRDLAVAAQNRKNGDASVPPAASDSDSGADSASDSETAATAAPAQPIPQLASLFRGPLPPLVSSNGDATFTEAESLPLVSVCITHYERATLLLHTLDGLAAQSYPASRLQVIVIDDGSPDAKTRAALDENVKPFVANQGKLWQFRSITNSYLGSARNQCRQWMKGDFFLFLDDDDFPHPSMVERFVQTALMTKAQLLSTHFQLFWGEGHPNTIFDLQGASRLVAGGSDNAPAVNDDVSYGRGIGWPLYPRADVDQSTLNAATPAVFLFLGSSLSTSFFSNSAGGANIFVRSCVFDVLGGFTEYRQVGFEDYEFLVNAAAHRVRHEVIEQPLLLVRRHVNSVSMQSQTVGSLNRARVLSRFLSTFSHSDVALDLSPLLLMTWGLHEEHKQSQAAPAAGSLSSSNVLADSEKQYSGVQGQDGWWYALLLLIDDFTGELMNPNLLRRPLAQEHEHEERHGQEEEVRRAAFFSATYFDGRWGCDRSLSSLCPIALRRSTYSWPEHRQWFTHPATSLPDSRDWRWSMHPVRRWVSHVQASVIITVQLELKQRECGEGVVYSLWIDRARVWKYNESKERKKAEKARKGGSADTGVGPVVDVDPRSLALSTTTSNSNPHAHHSPSNCLLDGQLLKCQAQLRVGSMVDFIVSPGPTEICDASVVRIKIRRA